MVQRLACVQSTPRLHELEPVQSTWQGTPGGQTTGTFCAQLPAPPSQVITHVPASSHEPLSQTAAQFSGLVSSEASKIGVASRSIGMSEPSSVASAAVPSRGGTGPIEPSGPASPLPTSTEMPAASSPQATTAAVAAATADDRICALDFQNGLIAIFAFIAQVNGYVSEQAPWAMAKTGNDERLDAVLYAAAESLRAIAVLLNPVMPRAAAKLWTSLGAQDTLGSLAQQRISEVARWGQLPVGARVVKGEILFPRIEEASA